MIVPKYKFIFYKILNCLNFFDALGLLPVTFSSVGFSFLLFQDMHLRGNTQKIELRHC
jgi:hypothetical protein